MILTRAEAAPTRKAPASYFTGDVWQDPVVDAPEPARVRAARVTFAPGARTFWHTHPLGQTLHVLAGAGRFQTWGEKALAIRAGDSIWIPPGEKHWHGAAADSMMVHLAIHEAENGAHVVWLEEVSEADYRAAG